MLTNTTTLSEQMNNTLTQYAAVTKIAQLREAAQPNSKQQYKQQIFTIINETMSSSANIGDIQQQYSLRTFPFNSLMDGTSQLFMTNF